MSRHILNINRMKTALAAAICAVLLCGACQTAGTVTKPALIQSATTYHKNRQSNEWVEEVSLVYTYENGYPVSIERTEQGFTTPSITTLEYTFENGKPVSMIQKSDDNSLVWNVEYNNGSRYFETATATEEDHATYNSSRYAYANDDDYFTLLVHANHMESEGTEDIMEEVDSVQVTVENGLLAKTVNTGMYANWGSGEEKEWMRFNGTYTAEYEHGIVKRLSTIYRAGPDDPETTFTVKTENGQIKEVLRTVQYGDADPQEEVKVVFEYTDIETDLPRYCQMINAHVMGPASTYYYYNWY